MSEELMLDLGDRSYPIKFLSARGDDFELDLKRFSKDRPMVVVTDSNVCKLYPLTVYGRGKSFVFPAGEENKNLAAIESLCNYAAENNFDRKTVFVAVGGGVVGDMVGFASAVYMRGVDFVQVPTTLLAMIDSSVGGKTGVDIAAGKNLIGAFKQPLAVLIDPDFLRTLPERELSGGLAEAVKYGVGLDAELFDFIEKSADDIWRLDMDVIRFLIRRCCMIKARVVEADETEQGCRALLNLGHTFGHALESLSKFAIAHGEGVAIGMRCAGELSLLQGIWSHDEQQRLKALLRKFKLPTQVPQDFKATDLIRLMKHDKKSCSGAVNVIAMKNIGSSCILSAVDDDLLRQAWERSSND